MYRIVYFGSYFLILFHLLISYVEETIVLLWVLLLPLCVFFK